MPDYPREAHAPGQLTGRAINEAIIDQFDGFPRSSPGYPAPHTVYYIGVSEISRARLANSGQSRLCGGSFRRVVWTVAQGLPGCCPEDPSRFLPPHYVGER